MMAALKRRQVARDVTALSFDAGHGEEPGRAAPRREAAAASTPSSPAACVDYIPLDEVAAACGVDAHEIHFRHRPRYWGIPKHWRWQAGKTQYAVQALPGLVEELELDGKAGAATLLKRYIETLSTGRGGMATTAGLESCQTTAAPASDPWYRKGSLA